MMNHSEKLYVWYNTLARKPKGLPFFDDVYLTENYTPGKKPESMAYSWMSYSPWADGFPPAEPSLRFPQKLYFIVQGCKSLTFDWMAFSPEIMIVSEAFLEFLKIHTEEECFETASLETVSRNGKELQVKTNYYAIRIGKYQDRLFNFPEEGRKRAAGLQGEFIYPHLHLKDETKDGVYFLSKFCYLKTVVITQRMKDIIKKEFYSPEIYRMEDFPAAFNNSSYKDRLPETV